MMTSLVNWYDVIMTSDNIFFKCNISGLLSFSWFWSEKWTYRSRHKSNIYRPNKEYSSVSIGVALWIWKQILDMARICFYIFSNDAETIYIIFCLQHSEWMKTRFFCTYLFRLIAISCSLSVHFDILIMMSSLRHNNSSSVKLGGK